ncbi:hypothetical protein BFW38_01715 [Terasakiispira papahanaumokuakeensis]|uniref:Esterase n=1 Tax=Terasakiispira papahanaumokuakeensis TaxID=197479 RepID=A0A1E2V613_9GAMM|nr:YqiA/YcfP family alpha/beta fold hydrolase [Terasakiispira papahanaumokuakeensis]ODC02450.1 hypothetical protein BFW38_01715 [Terasakiispira papahanaumokuakeensis]
MIKRLIYLHGFASSPQSTKAVALGQWLQQHTTGLDYQVPALSIDPAEAFAQAETLIAEAPGETALVGSSLGGFYALHLCIQHSVPAALVNPAMHPDRLLPTKLGKQYNWHTGEPFIVTEAHLAALKRIKHHDIPSGLPLSLFLQTGDMTLDYREALQALPGIPSWIEGGGDHGFKHFKRCLPALAGQLGLIHSTKARQYEPVSVQGNAP